MFIWLKKWLLETRILSFTTERVFRDSKWIKNMPYMVLRIPADDNQTKYDIPVPTNPLFDKLKKVFGITRVLNNAEGFSDLVTIDETNLLELWDYLENRPGEVKKILDQHTAQIWHTYMKQYPHYYAGVNKLIKLEIKYEGYNPFWKIKA